MKAFRIHSTVWALGITVLLGAVASASDLNFYVAVGGGVQSANAPGGKIRYVDMMVSSNENQSSAQTYSIFFTLTVKNASGADVCNNSIEFWTKVRPAIRPLRFQVFYPTVPRTRQPINLATKKYTLFGKIQVREEGTNKLLQTAQHQYASDFPVGGTPSCKILMTQGQ